MPRRVSRPVAIATIVLLAACGVPSHASEVAKPRVIASPPIPTSDEFVNPLRGQYEDLLRPLFPQGNPAQRSYSAWPGTYDASLRLTWRQLQPRDPRSFPPGTPDDRKYDFSVVDRMLSQLGDQGIRVTLRVMAYNSCCEEAYPDNVNIAIPDWLRAKRGASSTYPPAKGRPVAQVVPNWNHADYLAGFEQLLAALGRRYDGDERLSVFEFSGYGDFSENHIAYLRDTLKKPGPAARDSQQALGYFSEYGDQSITASSIQRLVAAHVAAFPQTQLVVTPQNPEIVRRLLSPEVTAKLSAPVGIRSDCLGMLEPLPAWANDPDSHYVTAKDPLVAALTGRLASAPVVTEWCQLPAGASALDYYEQGVRDVVTYHVSMTSSTNFPDRDGRTAMNPALFALWSRANVYAGYRYAVEAVAGAESNIRKAATVEVRWTNSGSAVATERWVAGYRVVGRSGVQVRALPSTLDLKALLAGQPSEPGSAPVAASMTERLRIDTSGLAPGSYSLEAAVVWQQHKPRASHVVHYPPMHLARQGRGVDGWYPVAVLDVS